MPQLNSSQQFAPLPAANMAPWAQPLTDLIAHIDNPQLPTLLVETLGQWVDFDSSAAAYFHGDYKPLVLHEDVSYPWRENRFDTYIKGAYLLDPFYLAYRESLGAGLYSLAELVPEGFERSEYFQTYYLYAHLADEIAFLVPTEDGGAVIMSIHRKEGLPPFSREERSLLYSCQPLIGALMAKYWQFQHGAFPQHGEHRIGQALQAALHNFGRSLLTTRECEVLQLMLRGHSNKSAADKLQIAPGTVKIHKEKIYAKLDISTQSELFHLFIDAVSSVTYQPNQDPLEQYLE